MMGNGLGRSYEELRSAFSWSLPERFNMGIACADQQPAARVALVDNRSDGSIREVTFGQFTELSTRLAHGLVALGVRAGDRVGVVIPQSTETGLAHLGIYKAGAVAVPLSILFGPDAIRFRLADCDARVVIVAAELLERVVDACADLDLTIVVVGDGAAAPHRSFDEVVAAGSAAPIDPATGPDSPALLIYTSGTTGSPKGALHGHRVLLGHMPGFDLMFNFFGQADDRMWTPADWAWIGGLLDAVLPTWFHGRSLVAAGGDRFDPQWAVDLMAEHRVRTAFLPPTALKLMRQSDVDAAKLRLRACMSGGEPLGREMLAWAEERLGVVVNEIYGQTEANLVVGNCHAAWPVVAGSMGRPFPGHEVAVIDDDGTPVPPGEVGEIGVRAPDPVMFLEYWNQPEATAGKFVGDWLKTGDLGVADEDGYLWFQARADDLINSAGYRIGPGEIEDCLLRHDAVAMVAVVGVPDELRGQVVKAYIEVAPGYEPGEPLADEIKQFVRTRLAAHEYPRQIEFIEALPMTSTGKIRRNVLRDQSATAGAGQQPHTT